MCIKINRKEPKMKSKIKKITYNQNQQLSAGEQLNHRDKTIFANVIYSKAE